MSDIVLVDLGRVAAKFNGHVYIVEQAGADCPNVSDRVGGNGAAKEAADRTGGANSIAVPKDLGLVFRPPSRGCRR
jgi:hypothetical protein